MKRNLFIALFLFTICACQAKTAYINPESEAQAVKITKDSIPNAKVIKVIEVSYAKMGLDATEGVFDELLRQEAYKVRADAVINVIYNFTKPGFGLGNYGTATGVAVRIDGEASPLQTQTESQQSDIISKSKGSQSVSDYTPPKIEIFEPASKERGIKHIVKEQQLLVKGKATDESGIADILINGDSVKFDKNGNFESSVRLDKGENYIIVKALDKHENLANLKIPVNYEKEQKNVSQPVSDYTPPKIEIFEPASKERGIKHIVKEQQLLVKGKATDESGIADILINGDSVKFDKNGNFESSVRLDKGENYIIVKALDKHENLANLKIPVNYEKEQKPVTEKRIALVVGNKDYKSSPLKNTVNDARDIADTLKRLSFDVREFENQNLEQMENAIRDFGRRLRNTNGVGLFYYAGHGLQVEGINYLIPVDAEIEKKEDVKYEAVDAGRVLAEMESAENPTNIIILDACRDNPFRSFFRSMKRGLAEMDAPAGAIISYATAPGSVSEDGKGKNGTYTEALLKYMKEQGLSIIDVFMKTRGEVLKNTDGKQQPWESSSLIRNFYFIPVE